MVSEVYVFDFGGRSGEHQSSDGTGVTHVESNKNIVVKELKVKEEAALTVAVSGSMEVDVRICFPRGRCDEFLSIRFSRNRAILTEGDEDGCGSSFTEADCVLRVVVRERRLRGVLFNVSDVLIRHGAEVAEQSLCSVPVTVTWIVQLSTQ